MKHITPSLSYPTPSHTTPLFLTPVIPSLSYPSLTRHPLIPPLSHQLGMPVVPIGMPIRGMFFLVVDLETISEYSTSSLTTHRPRLVTDGNQEGELWIGGIGVGLGYLNRPDLTEAVYLPNPFGEGMVYRTGDLVKRLDNGTGPYHFIRRIDNQVKVDGFRIELSEIEYVFLTHPLVQQCVVLLKKNVLVLYVKNKRIVTGEGDSANTWLAAREITEIKSHASRSLTYYMIPKIVVQVSKFEETPSGKINRNVLPEPDDVAPHLVDYSGIGGASTSASGGGGGGGGGVNKPKEEDEIDAREKQSKPDHLRFPLPTVGDHRTSTTLYNGTGKNGELKNGDHKNGDKNTSGGRALTKHILDIIEQVRGHRPTAKSSFATIGVDSLGAVMFIKQVTPPPPPRSCANISTFTVFSGITPPPPPLPLLPLTPSPFPPSPPHPSSSFLLLFFLRLLISNIFYLPLLTQYFQPYPCPTHYPIHYPYPTAIHVMSQLSDSLEAPLFAMPLPLPLTLSLPLSITPTPAPARYLLSAVRQSWRPSRASQ